MVQNKTLFGLLLVLLLNALGILCILRYIRSDVSPRSRVLVPPVSHAFDITHPSHVLVFLHIQKTGGSFLEGYLVNNIVNYTCPGEKVFLKSQSKFVSRHHKCFKPDSEQNWIFTRRTVGWPCGVHVDYSTLGPCARSYLGLGDWNIFFITLLRNPVDRFFSEFLHVKRGANWPVYEIGCSGGTNFPRKRIPPKCGFFGKNNSRLTLEEFMSCDDNPAINRMTHMLAGYGTIQCKYNTLMNQMGKDTVILLTAKRHLKEFEFFGIMELLVESAKLFENTFSVKFEEYPVSRQTKREKVELTPKQLARIESVNHLDVKLYNWAVELFKERIS